MVWSKRKIKRYHREYGFRWREKNRKKCKIHAHEYYLKNKVRIDARNIAWYWINRDEQLKKSKLYLKLHPEIRKKRYERAKKRKFLMTEKEKTENRNYFAGWMRKQRKRQKMKIFNHYCHGKICCMCKCGCKVKLPIVLTIDHKNGKGAEHRRKIGKTNCKAFYYWIIRNNFPKKFQILCFNCNQGRFINRGVCPQLKSYKRRMNKRQEMKMKILNYYCHGNIRCMCNCGCKIKNPILLTVDHKNGDGAEHRRKIGCMQTHNFYAWVIRNNYPRMLRILCFNCNHGRHLNGKKVCPFVRVMK